MNILYLSHLSGASYAGPTYSVPKQIESQSKIDNVFWYNATCNSKEEWKNIKYYHDLSEFPKESILSLPTPFNNPDLIVVELFYNMTKSNLIKELLKLNIPYIIIPRGELTQQAQKRKRIKKTIANILVCRKYAKKAAAIQYLTEQEYKDSGDSWNENHLIISNGIEAPDSVKCDFNKESIHCVSIGRIEPYQKGLDMLLEACFDIKDSLVAKNCTLTICGPDREGKVSDLKQYVEQHGLSGIISFQDAVYGDEKRDVLLDSDIFVIPSRFEGHPMAMIEALSYGLPCVATTGSNMRKEIEEFNAGWCADNNAESIKQALLDMISGSNSYSEKSTNAIKLSKKYLWDGLAEKSHCIFEDIVRRGNK